MDLMTTAEVADYLRIKERTVYDMAAKRQIPCTRATGKLLFSRKLIARWVESRTELPVNYDGGATPIYAGSSDPLLEWALREADSGLALLTGGSSGGVERLARGEAMLAGLHIRESGGGYNLETVRRELPFPDVVMIHWAERAQGLVVARDNPLGIAGFADLLASGAGGRRAPRVAVRPEGAGSRILFDALAQEHEVPPGGIEILPEAAQTEADLAALIAEGEADAGVGVAAAAQRASLGFVPLGVNESFDLVMRRRDYFQPAVQKLLAFTRSEGFARRAATLGGYDLSRLGQVVYNA